jgi:hypothetical protein
VIDIKIEVLLTLGQAARRIPRRRNDRPVSPSTIWRWCKCGVAHGGDRIYLESLKLPSGLVTSAEAMARFFDLLSAPGLANSPPAASATPSLVSDLDRDGI